MSWNLKFVARGENVPSMREKAINGVKEVTVTEARPYGIPPKISEAIVDAIENLGDNAPSFGLEVDTNGHLDSSGGSATFRVGWVKLLTLLYALALPMIGAAEDGPKFGGCLKDKTCFGPTVSVNVLAISIKTGEVVTQFSPGIGYGVTFHADAWYRYGLSSNFALKGTAEGQKAQLSIVGSFAEYVRIGVTSLLGAGNLHDNAAVLLAFGSDFGSSPSK